MTESEVQRLLYVAGLRPLAEYGRLKMAKLPSEQKGKRDTWKRAPLAFDDLPAAIERARDRLEDNPGLVTELERRGRERALVYKALVLTGLRRGELASLTVGSVDLDVPLPYAILQASDEKNRKGSEIPLRADLADDLRQWLAEQANETRDVLAISNDPVTLSADTPLLNVPKQLVKTLDRDLAVAGIAKVDDRGRSLDVHALRHSFGSLLSAGGVAPRTAQAAMRHSSIDLTMKVYTDPRLLDVHGALDALPQLPLDQSPQAGHRQRATGTNARDTNPRNHACTNVNKSVAPKVAPNSGNLCKLGTIADNSTGNDELPKNKKHPVKTGVSRVERKGLGPSTSALRTLF